MALVASISEMYNIVFFFYHVIYRFKHVIQRIIGNFSAYYFDIFLCRIEDNCNTLTMPKRMRKRAKLSAQCILCRHMTTQYIPQDALIEGFVITNSYLSK